MIMCTAPALLFYMGHGRFIGDGRGAWNLVPALKNVIGEEKRKKARHLVMGFTTHDSRRTLVTI